MNPENILEIENLAVGFGRGARAVEVTREVSFTLRRGEILALVGESGCGKSLSCLALTRLLPPGASILAGRVMFRDQSGRERDLAHIPLRELRRVRGRGIGYIFQEPAASLNPVFRVGDQIAEVILLHRPEIEDVHAEVVELLQDVGIPDPEKRAEAFPHELSGGMQQRVMIAMALAGRPELLIADEPTTALDVTIQSQILELIDTLRHKYRMAVILVTHNLGIVAELADRVEVMYGGMIVETAAVRTLLDDPRHPYTRALLAAVPHFGARGGRLNTIPGQVPAPGEFPPGCHFATRCPVAAANCAAVLPPWRADGSHRWRCIADGNAGNADHAGAGS